MGTFLAIIENELLRYGFAIVDLAKDEKQRQKYFGLELFYMY